jgi:hypothetical protein
MDLRQCLRNLEHDISNGGLEDDTSAAIWYIGMANEARQLLSNGTSDQKMVKDAEDYLNLCCSSGSDSLRCVAEG